MCETLQERKKEIYKFNKFTIMYETIQISRDWKKDRKKEQILIIQMSSKMRWRTCMRPNAQVSLHNNFYVITFHVCFKK